MNKTFNQCNEYRLWKGAKEGKEVDRWNEIAEKGLLPIGQPLIVTIKDNLQGMPNQLRYPVYYAKDARKGRYCWKWLWGDMVYDLLPEVSEVVAWQLMPEAFDKERKAEPGIPPAQTPCTTESVGLGGLWKGRGMERLTYEEQGKPGMICRYEDCDTGEEHCPYLNIGNCLCLQEILERLAEYERLECKGKLLKLPCAVGDTVYVIDTDERLPNREIKTYDIENIVIADNGTILLKHDSYGGVICELENIVTDKPYLDFYRCFLSQEEAEAALKEL